MPSFVVIVALACCLVVFVVIAAFLYYRRHRESRQMCGGCKRVMMPDWQRCLFCGWSPQARLEFLSGPLAGQVHELNDEITTLGSVPENTIVLIDPAVSRKHIGIRRANLGYELADLGSTNGVYVNGHRMPKKLLLSGDIMRVGNTEMVFRAG